MERRVALTLTALGSALSLIGEPTSKDHAMDAIVGCGDFAYRVQPNWAQLPDGWDFADVGGVAVDRHDRVYGFNRGGHR